jgi:Protein of unknown function (DUF2442)
MVKVASAGITGKLAQGPKRRGAKPNRTAFIAETQLREVVEARLIKDYVVEFIFDDLRRGQVDLRKYLGKGIFCSLLDKHKFKAFRVDAELGTIVWPNGADIAPDTLYLEINN